MWKLVVELSNQTTLYLINDYEKLLGYVDEWVDSNRPLIDSGIIKLEGYSDCADKSAIITFVALEHIMAMSIVQY